MKIYDITQALNEKTPVYPGDPPFKRQAVSTLESGGCSVSRLCMSSHAGTHVDAPSHVLAGAADASDIPLAHLMGPCMVCADAEDVAQALRDGVRRWIVRGDPAPYLREMERAGLLLVGTDGPSIGGLDAHRMLAGKGAAVLEGLALDGVPAGRYYLVALPLKTDTDGAPARVVLIAAEGGWP